MVKIHYRLIDSVFKQWSNPKDPLGIVSVYFLYCNSIVRRLPTYFIQIYKNSLPSYREKYIIPIYKKINYKLLCTCRLSCRHENKHSILNAIGFSD